MKLIKIEFPFLPTDSTDVEAYQSTDGKMAVLKSIDNTPKWGKLKHVSVSFADRYPTWDEILQVKEDFFGDTDAMMLMPKKEDYVNLHPNTFHIWQCPEGWGIQ